MTAPPVSPTQTQELAREIAKVMVRAAQCLQQHEFAQAQQIYETVLEVLPGHAEAEHGLAVALFGQGHAEEAFPHYEAALGTDPGQEQYWIDYIDALTTVRHLEAGWAALDIVQNGGLVSSLAQDALVVRLCMTQNVPSLAAAAQMLLSMQPGSAPAAMAPPPDDDGEAAPTEAALAKRAPPRELQQHRALLQKGDAEKALALARTLADRYPGDADAWFTLMVSLHRGRQYAAVLKPAWKILALLPDNIAIRALYAESLQLLGRAAEAAAQCREILARDPDNPAAHWVLSLALYELGKVDEGIAMGKKALELEPNNVNILTTLSGLVQAQGDYETAEALCRRALALDPHNANAFSNLLFTLTHRQGMDSAALFAEHKAFGERFENREALRNVRHANKKDPERALRIGWVSGDLYNHAVATYLLPAVKQLANMSGFKQFFYYNHVANDVITDRFREHAEGWVDATRLTDAELAQTIRKDGIDILVDLSGHTARNRLTMFALKPAPIQASWIGYPTTTGLSAMDYYLGAQALTPFSQAGQFTEKLVHLTSASAFQPYEISPPVNALPALSKGYVTFGSFNRLNKLRPDVIALWARILHALPTSRMAIGAITSKHEQDQVIGWFEQAGITADRLEFFDRTSWLIYLQRHHRIDLCLDAFPYSGSTVTGHAAWMGVPTLTLSSDTPQGSTSMGWMAGLGVPEFIASDQEDFVRKGVALAGDLDHLVSVRAVLRGRMQIVSDQSSRCIASLAQAFRIMWRRWCANKPVTHMSVDGTQAQPETTAS